MTQAEKTAAIEQVMRAAHDKVLWIEKQALTVAVVSKPVAGPKPAKQPKPAKPAKQPKPATKSRR